ncbi:MAG: MlaD family protein [Nitrospirota bacterium]
MRRLTTEAKVGLVILISTIVLTYMTFSVGDFKIGGEKGYRVYVLFNSVSGLELKSPVRIAGVEVGKVEKIELSDGKARVTLLIRPDVKLRMGAKASVKGAGLLGEKYLEIIAGQEDGYIKENQWIVQSGDVADVDILINQLSSIAADVKAVTTSIKGVLGTKEGEESLREIFFNIKELTRSLKSTVDSNKDLLNNTLVNLNELSTVLKDEIPQLIKGLNNIAERLEEGEGTLGKLLTDNTIYNRLNDTIDGLNKIAGRIERGEGTIGKLTSDEDVYNRLNSSLKNIDNITKKVERGEGTIGRLFADEDAYNSLNNTLKGFSKAMNRIEQIKTIVGFQNEFQFETNENKGYFSLHFQPREGKYYFIDLVDDPRGKVIKTTRDIVTDGIPSTTVDMTTKRQLKVSAGFSRRFSDFSLRAGLMENTFGIGADYYLLDDSLKLSFDAWDFNSDDPETKDAHLKTTVSYALLKYLFIRGGYDNFLNDKIDTLFLGAGLRFVDSDLKYFLTSVPIPLK